MDSDGKKEWLEMVACQRKEEQRLTKIALALLQQCKDENLTMKELDSVIDTMKFCAMKTTLRNGLTL